MCGDSNQRVMILVLKWLYVGKRNTDRPSRELILEQLSKL